MKGRIVYKSRVGSKGQLVHFREYRLDGRVVSGKEFRRATKTRAGHLHVTAPRRKRAWPMLSEAIGVHPDQIPEAREHAKRLGVPTEFTPDGRVIHPDRAHRKAYHAATGYFDRQAGYGDAARGSFRG